MAFDQLHPDDQIAHFTDAAHAALDSWMIPHTALELISFRSNAVFAVTAPQPDGALRLVLRVNWPGRKPFHFINCELMWMNVLGRNGVPMPEVLYMPRTVALGEGIPDMVCTLLSYLEGDSVAVPDYTPVHAAAVGRVAAQIHSVDHGFIADSPFRRPRLDFEGLFGVNSPYYPDADGEVLLAPHREVLDEVAARVAGIFARYDALGGQFGLIHGDLKPDNLLFNAPDVPSVLDFDDCGWGYYPYDLAPLLLFLRTPHPPTPSPSQAGRGGEKTRYEILKQALWAGYTALRPLPDAVFGDLETLVAGRYVASCRWVAAHRNHPAYRGKTEGILAGRAAELAGFLATGQL